MAKYCSKFCNKCGKRFDTWDELEDYSIHQDAGYGSKFDGKHIELDLCCNCMDELIESCRINPISKK